MYQETNSMKREQCKWVAKKWGRWKNYTTLKYIIFLTFTINKTILQFVADIPLKVLRFKVQCNQNKRPMSHNHFLATNKLVGSFKWSCKQVGWKVSSPRLEKEHASYSNKVESPSPKECDALCHVWLVLEYRSFTMYILSIYFCYFANFSH